MKKTIITLLAALVLLPATVSAQYKLVVKYNNEPVFTKDIWDVDSITFEPIDPKNIGNATEPQLIDLGLSVNWADRNLGAVSPKDKAIEWLVGWGDVTAKNVSTNLKWYPVENMTADNISDGNYDIVKQYYGSPWRLPTDEEMQELIDGCTWTYVNDADNDSVGFVGVSKTNSEKIFLPASGHRVATAYEEVNYYWSGTLNENNREKAFVMKLVASDQVTPTLDDVRRYMGCAIRPVNGELTINVSITAGEAYALNTTTATIDVQLGDSYAAYSSLEYGVYYSTNNDLNVESGRLCVSSTEVSNDGKHSFVLNNLSPGVTYYYTPYVIVRGKTVSPENGKYFCTPRYPVPEIVDMGLSVKWASFNVGASAPKQIGNYIGWGDATGTLTSTRSDDYARGNNSSYIGGNKDYDVAQATWGLKWRMPKKEEFEELFNEDNCTVVQNTADNYFAITSKKTGNTIILPAGGAITTYSPSEVSYLNYAFYWTAEANTSSDRLPIYGLFNTPTSISFTNQSKATRMQIRAVYQESSSNSGGQGTGDDDPGNNTGDNPGSNTGDNPGQTVDPVTDDAGNAVDLGLSVNWADRNVGATSATGAGYYLAWGDVEVRENYGSSYYVYSNPNGKNGYDYLGTGTDTSASYCISGTEYDAAHVLWKGTWRMPSHAELNELRENCEWVWTTQDNVVGYKVTSKKNGASIFLPAHGRKSGSVVYEDREYGYYWCGDIESSIPAVFNKNGETLEFSKDEQPAIKDKGRYAGLLIRPVCTK